MGSEIEWQESKGPVPITVRAVACGPIESVESGMGEEKLILAFVVIVIGGIGSIRGAFIASIIIGIVEIGGRIYIRDLMEGLMSSDFAQTAGPALASMLIYILMAAVLAFRPQGLFPPAGLK